MTDSGHERSALASEDLSEGEGQLEEQYRSFVEDSTGIVWWLNARGESDRGGSRVDGVHWTDGRGGQRPGLSRGYSIPRTGSARSLPGKRLARAFATTRVEIRLRRRDGVYRVMLSRGMPTARESQGGRGFVGTCVDITERKEAEEALREAARKNELDRGQLAEVFRAMSDSVYVFDMDGRLMFVNDAEARSLGLRDGEELVQRSAHLTAAVAPRGDPLETPYIEIGR